MTLITDIEDEWVENIWNHETVQAITTRAHLFEFTDYSEKEAKRLYSGKIINFFECVISAKEEFPNIGSGVTSAHYKIAAEIRYTIAKDTSGDNYRQAKAMPNTITNLVVTELGDTWNQTVDLWEVATDTVNVQSDQILEVPVWRIIFAYQAQKYSTIS